MQSEADPRAGVRVAADGGGRVPHLLLQELCDGARGGARQDGGGGTGAECRTLQPRGLCPRRGRTRVSHVSGHMEET